MISHTYPRTTSIYLHILSCNHYLWPIPAVHQQIIYMKRPHNTFNKIKRSITTLYMCRLDKLHSSTSDSLMIAPADFGSCAGYCSAKRCSLKSRCAGAELKVRKKANEQRKGSLPRGPSMRYISRKCQSSTFLTWLQSNNDICRLIHLCSEKTPHFREKTFPPKNTK